MSLDSPEIFEIDHDVNLPYLLYDSELCSTFYYVIMVYIAVESLYNQLLMYSYYSV